MEDRHFAGYSLKVSFDLVFHNGVRPDDSLVVPVVGSTPAEASVIWRTHDPTRAADVGRVSEILTKLGFKAGDEIVVVASKDYVRLLRPSEVPGLELPDGAGESSGPEPSSSHGGIHDLFRSSGT